MLGALGFPAATADGNVAEDAAFGPVAAAALAEVARLGEVIVIIIAELGIERIAAGALQLRRLVVVWPQPPITSTGEHPSSTAANWVNILHISTTKRANLHHPHRDLRLRLRCGGFGGNDRRLSFAATDFFAVILTAKIGDNKASTDAPMASTRLGVRRRHLSLLLLVFSTSKVDQRQGRDRGTVVHLRPSLFSGVSSGSGVFSPCLRWSLVAAAAQGRSSFSFSDSELLW
nr:hypothetical protein TorRG33x02_211930 [Ipomoea batatas]